MKNRIMTGMVAAGSLALLSGCAWHHTESAGSIAGAAPAGAAPASAAPASAGSSMARSELSPGTIRTVQNDLKQDGFYQGNVDGVWGPATAKALQTYQQRNNLHPSGELDSATLASLHLTPAGNAAAPGSAAGGMQSGNPTIGNAPAPDTMPTPPANPANAPPAQGQTQ